jgi:hypothetical protein
MVGLAHVARQAGNTEIAWDRYTEGVKLGRELDERDTIAITLAGLGGVAITSGQPSRGARLLAVSAALLESMPSAVRSFMGPVEQTAYEQDVAAACEELGEEEFARAWAEGRTMRVEEAIEYASKGDS